MKLPTLTQEQQGDFWSNVDKSDNCWLWTGKVYDAPIFEIFSIEKTVQCDVRRLAWFLEYNDDPDGRQVRNTCGNKQCVNPAHQRCPRLSPSTIRRREVHKEAKLEAKREKTQGYKRDATKKKRRRNRLSRERYAKKKAKRIVDKKRFREEDRQKRIAVRIEVMKDIILEERSR